MEHPHPPLHHNLSLPGSYEVPPIIAPTEVLTEKPGTRTQREGTVRGLLSWSKRNEGQYETGFK